MLKGLEAVLRGGAAALHAAGTKLCSISEPVFVQRSHCNHCQATYIQTCCRAVNDSTRRPPAEQYGGWGGYLGGAAGPAD